MNLSDFDFELPEASIAQAPATQRDGSRLLVLPRTGPEPRALEHLRFAQLEELLVPGDLLVLNDTRVRRARLRARRPTGGAVELLMIEPLEESESGAWRCLARPAAKLRPGMRLLLGDPDVELVARERCLAADGSPAPEWIVEFRGLGPVAQEAVLERLGELPLPPYVRRDEGPTAAQDLERYQTVVAKRPGAVAAPTAGLHFTTEMLDALRARGVEVTTITLEVGPGTFRPVATEQLDDHEMHAESYEIQPAAARAIEAARERRGRVVAVGTTVVRTLESSAREHGRPVAGRGRTALFLRPGAQFAAVDALITNFHLPKSTLLMLVCAFAGQGPTMGAYREAVASGYRFYSYGDAMFIG